MGWSVDEIFVNVKYVVFMFVVIFYEMCEDVIVG